MIYLRYNTAHTFNVGTIVSNTDGVTEITTLASAMDHTSTGIRWRKPGVGWVARTAGFASTVHDELGEYTAGIVQADAAVYGRGKFKFRNALCAPWEEDYYVLPQNVWDAWFTASTALQVALTSAGVTAAQAGLATSAAMALVQADTDDIQSTLTAQGVIIGLIKAQTDKIITQTQMEQGVWAVMNFARGNKAFFDAGTGNWKATAADGVTLVADKAVARFATPMLPVQSAG